MIVGSRPWKGSRVQVHVKSRNSRMELSSKPLHVSSAAGPAGDWAFEGSFHLTCPQYLISDLHYGFVVPGFPAVSHPFRIRFTCR